MSDPPPVPEPAPQWDGYLVVLRPERALAQYLQHELRSTPDRAGFEAWWREHRALLPGVDPTRYAGWDREPLRRAPSAREIAAWAEQRARLVAQGVPVAFWPESIGTGYSRAEHLMQERLGEDPSTYGDYRFVSGSVIPDLSVALEILAATEPSDAHEVVRVIRLPDGADGPSTLATERDAGPRTLGYDVGAWGGPFSLLSDTMVFPRWHPATDEAIPALREHAAGLNSHALFPTAAAADAFRRWYRTQEWGEIEFEGEYCIARIDAP